MVACGVPYGRVCSVHPEPQPAELTVAEPTVLVELHLVHVVGEILEGVHGQRLERVVPQFEDAERREAREGLVAHQVDAVTTQVQVLQLPQLDERPGRELGRKVYTKIRHRLPEAEVYTYIRHKLPEGEVYTNIKHRLPEGEVYTNIKHRLPEGEVYTNIRQDYWGGKFT